MTETPPIQLVCLDMAGTTVADGGTVERAFETALDSLGVAGEDRTRMAAYVRETMGTSKIEVFRSLFGDEDTAQAANRAFEDAYEAAVDRIEPLPGAEDTMRTLRGRGIRVALTTGFSARTRDMVIDALGWKELADLVLSPSDAGRGRPYPDMVLTAVLRLRIDDVRAVAVAGDTAADVTTGLRAGASVVAGVLTGADGRDRLLAAGASVVLDSVAGLPPLLP